MMMMMMTIRNLVIGLEAQASLTSDAWAIYTFPTSR
jgi:hypothetical protein